MKNRALFLDRDGVINIDKDYVYKIEDIEFIDSIFEVCKHFQDSGYQIFVITNQSGIARGYYSEKDFYILTEWMLREFQKRGIIITKVYFCPHHPEYTGECECRKPQPGMIIRAYKEYNLDLKNSILVGDSVSDIQAGINAGIEKLIYLKNQKKPLSLNYLDRVKVISNLKELIE